MSYDMTLKGIRANRWWIYQKERFPIIAHGLLIAAFSFSGMCLSALLRGSATFPALYPSLTAFLVALLFFLLLRIADEFKDAQADARYRPYRPVPRGLVSLRELGCIGATVMLLQLALTWLLDPRLVVILLGAWIYWVLMSKEFFVAGWLKKHHFTYLWTHMLIIAFIDLYVTACEWLTAGASLPDSLTWFLLASLFNGVVIEVGRKIRAPADEEPGVDTYSSVWGCSKAVLVWLSAMTLTAVCAGMIAQRIQFFWPVVLLYSLFLCASIGLGWWFLRRPTGKLANQFERVSFFWTLSMYLSLGSIPMIAKLLE